VRPSRQPTKKRDPARHHKARQSREKRIKQVIGSANRGSTGTIYAIRPGFCGDGPKECQWIDGEPKGRSFCGAPTVCNERGIRSSWCREHFDRVFMPDIPKVRS
jgi:hypothetical protein